MANGAESKAKPEREDGLFPQLRLVLAETLRRPSPEEHLSGLGLVAPQL